jgi:hypothetical protein
MDAAKHTIQLEPGVTPINTRPYRLLENQKEEIGRQVEQLVNFPKRISLNSPLLTSGDGFFFKF